MLTVVHSCGHGESCDVEDGDSVVPQVHQSQVVLVEESVVADVTDFVILENYCLEAWEERQNAKGANSVSARVKKFQLKSVT